MAQGKQPKEAAPSDGQDQSLVKKLAEWQALAQVEPPEKAQPTPEPTPVEAITEKASTVPAAVEVPVYPRDLIVAAEIENEHRDFQRKLLESRMPSNKPEYKPPPLPPALIEQTRLEMEAGAKRVAEFEKIKAEQKTLTRVKEPWEGTTVEVFRPPDFTEYKKEFRQPGQTVSKDQLKR